MHKKQLIKKFLRNECSAEEAELVIRYLEEEPALLDEMVGKTEWDEVPANRSMNRDVEVAMRRTIKAETSATPIRKMMIMAVAACIAGIILLGYFMRFNSGEKPPAAVIAAVKLEHWVNATSVVQQYLLPDGSEVSLYPGSAMHFEKGLIHNRNISLEGKADFAVAKNEDKPFRVDASGITTTALGTFFRVDATIHEMIEVQLFEGKVVVKSVSPRVAINDIYLTPGKQCRIDLTSAAVSVTPIPVVKTTQPVLPAKQSPVAKVPEQAEAEVTLDFAKAPVAKVFGQIEKMYGVEIGYDIHETEGAYFTGVFKPGSALNTILDIVCSMNGLNWSRVNDTIYIEKSKDNKEPREDGERKFPASSLIQSSTCQSNVLMPHTRDIEVNAAAPEAIKAVTYYVREDGTVLFNKARLTDVLKVLQRIKASKINFFENEIEHVYVTGSVDKNSSLEQSLTAICAMNGLRLDIENEQFVIRRN